MKVALAICAVVLLAGLASAEFCHHDDDCTLTVCTAGQKLDCWEEHDKGNLCTCVPTDGDQGTGIACNSADQCTSHYGRCEHNDHRWHCFDNRCRCKF